MSLKCVYGKYDASLHNQYVEYNISHYHHYQFHTSRIYIKSGVLRSFYNVTLRKKYNVISCYIKASTDQQ